MTTVTWLAIGETIWVVSLCAWIILERRSPTATLAWIFALAWLPIVGVALYLLVGPRRLRRKRLRYRAARLRMAEAFRRMHTPIESAAATALGDGVAECMTVVQRAGQGPALRANHLEVLPTGDGCYAALEKAIGQAQQHIHMEYYIWEPDGVGTWLRDQLCAKARSGVAVRLLLDAIGSAWAGRQFLRPLREAGVEIAWFNPMSLARFRPDLVNFRTHRKIVVCDGRVGFTGGMNVCDSHSETACGKAAWRDTQVMLEGPPVTELQWAFLEDWHFATGRAPSYATCFPAQSGPADGPLVQVIASGPDHDRYPIEKFVFSAIAAARQRVLLTTPYFVPNEAILMALVAAALRGAEVKILVPEQSDSRLVSAAARSYFKDLIRVGVRIFEYGPPMLHAKTMVVDRQIALVGTANMDNRSFRLNFEIAAAIYDERVAAELAAMFEADLELAKEYSLRDASHAPLLQRMGEASARLLSPLL